MTEEKKEVVVSQSLPQATVQEMSLAISTAISTGITQAVVNILKAPEVSEFVEGLTRSRGITGILQGLAAAEGRKALDARTMDQNALEIHHLMDRAIGATKLRLQEKVSGVELDPEIKDAESDYNNFLKNIRENDNGV